MIKIALFCAAGMSTSVLVSKMKKAAQEKGVEVDVEAFPDASMAKHLNGVDVVLLGPQVRFILPKVKKLCDPLGIPVEVIASVDYGMMNGQKVLESALKLIKK